ncbi:MAG TPA: LacI family DNA-binding transcriptional regulator, partial [Symbiobacteriaceae bacterium]|nr:LacI family DNA-binding transcriptional regulator [Symbiobacteriaceae bacterium]
MATIKDVARAAGVAPSTVSRVLAGSSRISPETHEKVRAAMQALNYHPNDIARSLVGKATHTIGLVIARPAEQAFANPFFPEVIRGIGAALHPEGYNLMLTMTATPAEERSACMRLLRQRRVDGVILTSARSEDKLVTDLLAEQHPFVLIGRGHGLREMSWVNNDNEVVGEMAVAHLMAVGAVQALKEQGKVRSVAIVGVNDDPLTSLIDPPLTTIRIPIFDLGATAARLLLD